MDFGLSRNKTLCAFLGVLLFLPIARPACAKGLSDNSLGRTGARPLIGARKIFRTQVERLIRLGYPQAMQITPDQFRAILLPLSAQLSDRPQNSKRNNIPFLIVIPPRILSVGTQFDLLEIGKGKRGSALYRPTWGITDTISTPTDPYLIFDVDLGNVRAGTHPFRSAVEARELLAERGRRGLTMAEAISLVPHSVQTVRAGAVYATASSWPFDGTEAIPRIGTAFGYPLLTYVVAEYFHRDSLPASCQEANLDK